MSTYSNELREQIWKKLEWYFGGNRQNMRVASKEITAIADSFIQQATKAAEVRGKLWGIDLAFDSHDYDRIRKVKAELEATLKLSKEKS